MPYTLHGDEFRIVHSLKNKYTNIFHGHFWKWKYFKDYPITKFICLYVCALCACVYLRVCKCMPMMHTHAAMETRRYSVLFCPLSLSTLSSWNRVSWWIWISPFCLGWHVSVTLLPAWSLPILILTKSRCMPSCPALSFT